MDTNKIYSGNSLEILKSFPSEIANTMVTSPPYFQLRDYNVNKTYWPPVKYSIMGFEVNIEESTCCLVLEKTPFEFIGHLILIFREAYRVLKKDGTAWINIGDSYSDNKKSRHVYKNNGSDVDIKQKDLIGIPWMLAFALRDDGWYLRQDIIWNKPNPMPESVTDRCTKSHEYIFLFSKSKRYYFDSESIKTNITESTLTRMNQYIEKQKGSNRVPNKTNGAMKAVGPGRNPRPCDSNGGNQGSFFGIPPTKQTKQRPHGIVRDRLLDYDSKEKVLRGDNNKRGGYEKESDIPSPDIKANKKSVWTVTTKPFTEAHFAVFPPELIKDCILAGCPEHGIVLEPFSGSGTTYITSNKLGRQCIAIEIGDQYINISDKLINKELGLFKP